MIKTQNTIYWQDEILQILYWMKGEGLGEVVTLDQINRFLKIDQSNLIQTVERLVQNGLLEQSSDSVGINEVQLTNRGIKEGKLRFKEEFENILGHEDHMVCDDPDCDCHSADFEGVCHHFSAEEGHLH